MHLKEGRRQREIDGGLNVTKQKFISSPARVHEEWESCLDGFWSPLFYRLIMKTIFHWDTLHSQGEECESSHFRIITAVHSKYVKLHFFCLWLKDGRVLSGNTRSQDVPETFQGFLYSLFFYSEIQWKYQNPKSAPDPDLHSPKPTRTYNVEGA